MPAEHHSRVGSDAEQRSRSCWPSKHYEALGASIFYCAETDWDMSYKTPETLLFLFEAYTSLEESILHITVFSFAFTLVFILMNCLEPYLQNSIRDRMSLFCF